MHRKKTGKKQRQQLVEKEKVQEDILVAQSPDLAWEGPQEKPWICVGSLAVTTIAEVCHTGTVRARSGICCPFSWLVQVHVRLCRHPGHWSCRGLRDLSGKRL